MDSFAENVPLTEIRQTVTVLIVLMLITLPVGPAVAQNGPPDSVVLDSGAEQIATMEVEGDSYTVYDVDNALPYASGIEVYSNGQEITNPSEAKPVLSRLAARRTLTDTDTSVPTSAITSQEAARNQFRTVAWEVSANRLSESDIRRLESASNTASRIDEIVSPPLSVIDAQLALFQRMRDTGLFGVTAWDVATEASPSLEQYEQVLGELQTQLSELNDAAERVGQNINPAIDSLRKAQQGENVDYERLSQQLKRTSDSLEQLQSKADQVASSLSTAQDGAKEAEESLKSSRLPNRFVQPLSELSGELGQAAADVESFSSDLGTSRQQFSGVRETASERRQALLTEWQNKRSSAQGQWEARQSAQTSVFGTLGGGGVVLAGAVVLGRRFL